MNKEQKIKMYEKNQQKLINALVKKNREYNKLAEKYKELYYKSTLYSMMLSTEEMNAADVMTKSIHKREMMPE